MSLYRLTAAAHADLLEIGRFTQQKWGRRQRIQYLERLEATLTRLANNPEMGKRCDSIRAGYRTYPVGRQRLFYRPGPDGTVEVIRILHQAMSDQLLVSSP
jgi:toxin ParE1/3/4